MNKNVKKVYDIFESHGIDNSMINDMDSLTYMIILADIESVFNIEIPDELLIKNNYKSIDDFVEIVQILLD